MKRSLSRFDEKFLQCFWDLAVADEKKRQNAAKDLLTFLEHEQTEDTSKQFPKFSYALTRLIRGLGSSRDCARQGFSTALAQVT